MNTILFLGAALVFLGNLRQFTTLDIKDVLELPCFKISETATIDLNWVTSPKAWYYPIMSKYDLYLSSIEISGKSAEELRDHELYYESCITWETDGSRFSANGFHRKSGVYNVKPIKGFEIFEAYKGDELLSTCYTPLTDNKTFLLTVCCMSEGHMTWGVMSTIKQLPPETVKNIHEYVASLGFKQEYFTQTKYDSCYNDNIQKEEL